ncbi:MAG: class I SAM-dependent methyltransferase [Candidatus Goldiibacteriota bacterium]|jgi:ubiquinone/menaquinone biosynthesis C-methylase UbiE
MTPDIAANVTQYRERVISKTKKYFSGATLLDSGCGDGEDLFLRKKYFKKITGVDIAESPRWKELSGGGITFKKCDSQKLPFKNSSFDTVLEKDMLHHAENPEKALKEMVRVAKKRVIVIEANRYNPLFYINLTLLNNHQHFTQKRFHDIMESTGLAFTIERFSARVCWINNPAVISLFDAAEDMLEKIAVYSPIIEYNLGIITKK